MLRGRRRRRQEIREVLLFEAALVRARLRERGVRRARRGDVDVRPRRAGVLRHQARQQERGKEEEKEVVGGVSLPLKNNFI